MMITTTMKPAYLMEEIAVEIMVVIMMVEAVAQILNWLEMDFAMMTLILVSVIMMVQTVEDTKSTQSIALNAHASTKRLA